MINTSERLKHNIIRLSHIQTNSTYINAVICEDILMRNGYIECFRSEAFCGRTHSAVPLRLRLQIYKKEPVFAGSYMHSNLRGIFDEKRLDEIF